MWAARKLGLLGRSTRTNLLGFFVFCLLGSVILWFVGLARFRAQVHAGTQIPFALFPAWVLYLEGALGLIFLWFSIRRINDQDRPGWLALVPLALSVAIAAGVPIPQSVAGLAGLACLALLFLPGTIGPNRYGADPRGWKSRAHYLEQRGGAVKGE
ncbi:MAG: hypothetical protein QOG13_429 [Sphingomonadales bacterium]|jgi:uncharacterized membrane protein YhaH (DUF805 family)|nr:hypothetical protein [Sphingomonadales bacterium]MEA3043185.1 hypothetical protein [Sphingomonadales bacterium]